MGSNYRPAKRSNLKGDDVVLAGVGARDLDCILNDLRTAVGKEEACQAGRSNLQQPIQHPHLQMISKLFYICSR